jgi:hypothetical protein
MMGDDPAAAQMAEAERIVTIHEDANVIAPLHCRRSVSTCGVSDKIPSPPHFTMPDPQPMASGPLAAAWSPPQSLRNRHL